ncbi:MAG: Lrp/AsnC family transcriptional regulator [Candidatus Nitrosocosmicus sp.]
MSYNKDLTSELRRMKQSINTDSKMKSKNTNLNDLTPSNRKEAKNIEKFDKIDIQILSNLLKNADIRSIEISNKLKIPLSTIQRRRSIIDKSSMLKKGYQIDYKQFGLRRADIMVTVSKGDCVTIAKEIVKQYRENVLEASITIGDPKVNLVLQIVYNDSDEIFDIIQHIKRMEHVEDARWSEIIKAVVKNDTEIVEKLLSKLGNR